jgi:hypothetical protein
MINGMKKASASLQAFAVKADAALIRGTGPIVAAAKAIGSVVNSYFIQPFRTAGKVAKDWGGALRMVAGDRMRGMSNAFRGVAKWTRDWAEAIDMISGGRLGRVFGAVRSGLGMNLGAVAARGIAGVRSLGGGGTAGRVIAGAGRGLGVAGIRAATAGFRALTGAVQASIGVVGRLSGMLFSLPSLIAGGALAGLFVSAARGAMNLFEEVNRGKVVFGSFSAQITGLADRMAVAFGYSKRELLSGASGFADVFKGAGYSDKDVAALSEHFVKLAADMTSFRDNSFEQSLEKLHSGLSGETEPLRRLGVSVYEATIKEYAYAHGIAKVGEELTERQKIESRIAVITEKSKTALNDLGNTANSAANSVRGISGRFENLKESIGTTLVGLLMPVFQDLNVGLHAIQMAWDSSRFAADEATKATIAGANGSGEGIGLVQRTIMYAADAWRSFKINALDAIVSVTSGLVDLMDSLRTTAYLFLETGLQKKGNGFSRADYEKGIEKLQDFRRSTAKQRDEMEKTPLPSLGIADAFSAARLDIERKRAGLDLKPFEQFGMGALGEAAMAKKTTAPLDLASVKPTPAAPLAKAAEDKFASAAVAGSSEAANAVLKSRFGAGGAKSPENQTAKNTAETVALLRRMVGGSREPFEIKGLTRAQQAGAGFLGAFF